MNTSECARGETTQSLIEMLKAYLSSFGLIDPVAVSRSARRVAAAAVDQRRARDFGTVRERALRTARRWVENFARRMSGDEHDWYFAIPTLLRRFPRTFLDFLESEHPEFRELDADRDPQEFLPAEQRCRMKAQEIEGAMLPFTAERSVSSSP